MCSIYNMYIQMQLDKKIEVIAFQKSLVAKQLDSIRKIKPLIEHYIDYNALLNGKVAELPADFEPAIVNFKLSNIAVKNYYHLYKGLLGYEEEMKILKRQKIKYNIYKDIISSFNKAIIKDMLETGDDFDNIFLGKLGIYYKENHNKSIDWEKSLANKEAIIARGGEPYLRKNYIAATEEGREYNAEKWLVKRGERPLLSLKWRVAPKIINELQKEGANYKFFPARGNSGVISFLMKIYENPEHDYSIYKTKW